MTQNQGQQDPHPLCGEMGVSARRTATAGTTDLISQLRAVGLSACPEIRWLLGLQRADPSAPLDECGSFFRCEHIVQY